MRRVYLDSCIVIYLVERNPIYFSRVRERIEPAQGIHYCCSPLVRLETLVKPIKENNEELIQLFDEFFFHQHMLVMTTQIYDHAARLRAYFGLKTPDALHLATARFHKCTEFWTHDNRLIAVAPELSRNILVSN